MTESANCVPQDSEFLSVGDWISIHHWEKVVCSQGFKTQEVTLKPSASWQYIDTIFLIELAGDCHTQEHSRAPIHYGQRLYLQHSLSGKYLSHATEGDGEQVKLKTIKDSSCELVVLPLFLCQVSSERRIRNGEQCNLQSSIGYRLHVEVNSNSPSFQKNECSHLVLRRRNEVGKSEDSITNMGIYRVCNVEYENSLYASETEQLQDGLEDNQYGDFVQQDLKTDKSRITFRNQINEYGSYVLIDLFQGQDSAEFTKEKSISFGCEVVIKYYSCNKYLSFGQQEQATLSASPTLDCVFIFQPYNEEQLNEQKALKIQHKKSGKYLSMRGSQVCLDEFQLINTFQLQRVDLAGLRMTLFINEMYQSLLNIYQCDKLLTERSSVKKYLRKIVRFFYCSHAPQEQFLAMQSNLKLKVTAQQQCLLANVGFLQLLMQLCQKLLVSARTCSNQAKSELQSIMCLTMMVTVGICLRNLQNIKLFNLGLVIYYKSIGYATGVVEGLFHIFSNNRESLTLLESLEHLVQGEKMHSVDLLIENISNLNVDLQLTTKIVKLLECLVIVQGREKILVHESCLLKALKSGKLKRILLAFHSNAADQIVLDIGKGTLEFEQLLANKTNYRRELMLLKAQINLLISVCAGSNINNFLYFRTFISQATLHKYFKSNLEPEYRLLLLRALNDIYLKVQISNFSGNLLLLHKEGGQRQESLHQRIIFRADEQVVSKILSLLLQATQKAIKNEIIDSSLYMNITTLRSFLELQILQPNEVIEFKLILEEFIRRNYQKGARDDIRKLIVEILRIFLHYETMELQRFVSALILKFKHIPDGVFRKSQRTQKVLGSLRRFLQTEKFFDCQDIRVKTDFLSLLTKQALADQDQILFYEASMLLKRIQERDVLLVSSLKDKIIIDSPWSYSFYFKVIKLKADLLAELSEYSLENDNKDYSVTRRGVAKAMESINYLFYEFANVPEDAMVRISPFAQNILRQFNVMDVVVQFVSDYKKDLRDYNRLRVFTCMFEFIGNFVDNNETNLLRLHSCFSRIEGVFAHEDVGQQKLLYSLVTCPKARQLMGQQLYDCTLHSIRSNQVPRPYSMLCLVHLMHGNDLRKINQPVIDQTSTQLLQDDTFVDALLKIKAGQFRRRNSFQDKPTELSLSQCSFKYQSSDEKRADFNEYFSAYFFLVIRCLLLLVQHSPQRSQLTLLLLRKLRIELIWQLLLACDIVDGLTPKQLLSTLLKHQLIVLLQRVYHNELRCPRSAQVTQMFLSKLHQKIIYCKLDRSGGKESLINQLSTSDSHQLTKVSAECLAVKENCKHFQKYVSSFAKYFSQCYLIVVVYYPLILRTALAVITGERSAIFAKEMDSLFQIVHRKLKDFLQNKFRQQDYHEHQKQYNEAISSSEEMLKCKVGFAVQEGEQKTEQAAAEQQSRTIFLNKKIHNTVHNYIYASSQSEKLLYQCMLWVFYSQEIKSFLGTRVEEKRVEHYPKEQLMQIYELIRGLISSDLSYATTGLEIFLMYTNNHPQLLEFVQSVDRYTFRQFLGLMLSKQRNDPANTVLRQYFFTSSMLIRSLIHTTRPVGPNILEESFRNQREKDENLRSKQAFYSRVIQFMQAEGELYSRNQIKEQMQVYSQSFPLSFQAQSDNLTIELVLQWIRNKMLISRNFEKRVLDPLLVEVISLLKVYVDFLLNYNCLLVSQELVSKMELCLDILQQASSGADAEAMQMLIDRQIWKEINAILFFDDSWKANIEDINIGVDARLTRAMEGQTQQTNKTLVKLIQAVYHYSSKVYGQKIVYQYSQFPLRPISRLYGRLKQGAIALLKQFKQLPHNKSAQLFQQISLEAMNKNIEAVYEKHFNLFPRGSLASLETDIVYQGHEYQDIARNLQLENGVDLVSLKMFAEALQNNPRLELRYKKEKTYASSKKRNISLFRNLLKFCQSLWRLMLGCCRHDFQGRVKSVEQLREEIQLFFLPQIGRVQLFLKGQLHSCDFIVRPECLPNSYKQQKFIKKINFVSVQLKLQSIINSASLFTLVYQNQFDFYCRFRRFGILCFLSEYMQILLVTRLVLVYVCNILLLAQPANESNTTFYRMFSLKDPFCIIAVVNFSLSLLYFIIFLLKDVPLILSTSETKLRQGIESFKNYSIYNFYIQKAILCFKLIFHPIFLYNVASMVLLSLTFYNKLFVAILSLDILIQVKPLKNLLMTIWRPKFQIILAIVSFNVIQYFYGIFIFYLFHDQAVEICGNFGECFGFIYVTAYKLAGGFVGYLYLKNEQIPNPKNNPPSFFDLFADVYVIMIYQIFFSVILVLVVDSFSMIRSENFLRQENLNKSCLICSLDRSLFNVSSTTNFKRHLAISHNIWAYFAYYHYILRKPVEKRTQFERTIYLNFNTDWLPNNYALGVKEPYPLE